MHIQWPTTTSLNVFKFKTDNIIGCYFTSKEIIQFHKQPLLCRLWSGPLRGTPFCPTYCTVASEHKLRVCTLQGFIFSVSGNRSWEKCQIWQWGHIWNPWADRHLWWVRQRLLWCRCHSRLQESQPPRYSANHIQGATAWNGAWFLFQWVLLFSFCFGKNTFAHPRPASVMIHLLIQDQPVWWT